MPATSPVAWVTGGGRGIGRASAIALARAGSPVAVSARTAKELGETVEACKAEGADAFQAACDVTDPRAVAKAHAAIAKRLEAPTILVNAAGVARSESFLKTTPEFMRMHWDLNVMGSFHAIQAALPAMLEGKWGRIINIASIAALEGAPYIAAYAASKHGLLGLTRVLATEVGPKGVAVSAVCPGYVDTKMTDENFEMITEKTGLSKSVALQRALKMSNQERLVRPEEVAAVVVRLAGDKAEEFNGRAIVVKGGRVEW